ncbi:MAG: protease Do, partial [Akkermansiaceae bacterium]|nr:protease Do [Akkermansiaceae bacterium]
MKMHPDHSKVLPAAAAGLVFLAAVSSADPSRQPLDLPLDSKPIDRVTAPTPTSFAPMLEKTTPAVVAVYTAEIVRVVQSSGSAEEELLRRLFGLPTPYGRNGRSAPEIEERKVPVGTGSGVIVSREGYILTNNHVVIDQQEEDADEILVRLNDGRELRAEIVGRDPKTDIAVLKVDATGLPAIRIADSDKIEVGDVVFAIGNPMRVGT